MNFDFFMKEALIEAKEAFDLEEVPIGAVIVENESGKIIARGHNMRNTKKNALCHAEIYAINEACKYIGDWRLENCTIFITVEPCPMCAGAIIQARIPTVVFGARNKKAGCGGSVLNILREPNFNHQAEIFEGVLGEECAGLMSSFFKRFR